MGAGSPRGTAETLVTHRVGHFTLRPDQVATVERLLASVNAVGGALLADPPGTGKTVVALAVAATEPSAVVCAPAAVRDHWATLTSHAGIALPFVSLEALSRGAVCPPTSLIIVDEAHQLRTPRTRRYRTLAAACIDRRVLLLSATPVVNRLADRTALLALFLGPRAGQLSPAALGACVIRGGTTAVRPTVGRGGTLDGTVTVPGLAAALRTLPPPLPLSTGAVAHPLVLTTLAMAWQSSLAALDAALRRRVQRGEAIHDLLAAGRRPTAAALRAWVVDGTSTQLAFAALVDAPDASASRTAIGTLDTHRRLTADSTHARDADWCAEAHAVVRRHLDAVRALRDRIAPWIAREASARAIALRQRLAENPTDRGIVFAHHRATVEALHAALRADSGIVSLTGARVKAAAGRWSRAEVVAALQRDAGPWRPDDPRGIRLVLASDVLSEGIELPAIRWLVHADLPWTPARLEQRLGRIPRARADGVVRSYRFAASDGCVGLLRLAQRLATKAQTRRSAVADAGDAAAVRIELLALTHRAARTAVRTAALAGSDLRGIALTRTVDGERLIGVRRGADGRWRATDDPRRLRRWIGLVKRTEPTAVRPSPAHDAAITTVRRALARYLAQSAWRAEAVAPEVPPPELTRLRRRLDAIVARAPALERHATAARHARWLARAAGRLEVGRARRLHSALRTREDAPFLRAIAECFADDVHPPSAPHPAGAPRLIATLVLVPTARA
ncbi:MAG: helicase-related protein [Gemmatimonadaceae bacterium]